MKDIRVAAAIFNSPLGKIRDNLDRMAVWVAQARQHGAAIICFPELSITGYSTRDEIRGAAIPVSGEVSRHLQQLARNHQITILAGLAEKVESLDKSMIIAISRYLKSQLIQIKDKKHHVFKSNVEPYWK